MAKIESVQKVTNDSTGQAGLVVQFEPERFMERNGATVPIPNEEFFTDYVWAMEEVEPGKPRFMQILEERRPLHEQQSKDMREQARQISEGLAEPEEEITNISVQNIQSFKGQSLVGREFGSEKGGKAK